MENHKLLAILRAFKALFEALPSEAPSEKYKAAYQQLHESYSAILHTLLAAQHFAFCRDPDCECVSIFNAETGRDSFVKVMKKLYIEMTNDLDDVFLDKKVCKPMTFKEFLVYANGSECDLENYSLEEDGVIEFERNNSQ